MKRNLFLSRSLVIGLVLVTQYLSSHCCDAATRFWDGGAASGFWDASANWSNNVSPVNGDILVFPSSSNRLINTNRASAGLTNFSSLRFLGDDYQIFSAALNITNGITNIPAVGALNTLNAVIQPRASQTWSIGARKLLTLNSNVVFPATPAITLTVDVGG